MKIKPNASPSEMSSPFFKLNKEFCSQFESFIASKNGKVKGHFNSWSYLVFGKISNPEKWNLMYKKSTFTSTGNLLFSSKYQCLLTLVEWETDRKGTHHTEFVIRRKSRIDFIKLMFNNSLSRLDVSNKYVVHFKGNKSKLFFELIEVLKELFKTREVYKIEHRNEKLKIELRSEKHHFDVFTKLTELVH
ncbi:hypothetical protein [Flavivirga eckloniae]|uniref:Uncharacterized protein n=1 Tax=Flavivirga eckloniae TaxID=1803846 RepID=A0A2K9PTW6_9FLAO|nr:hypothetical protein [Flavivirga eckloniae]AUP80505.1 hypothetical protein C1H87_18020 [Flavivirga eckloniae]